MVRNASKLAAALTLLVGAAVAQQPPLAYMFNRPDSFVARVEALALLQTLHAELLGNDSATATLGRWCGEHRLAPTPRIVAEQVPGVYKAPTPDQRRELDVTPGEPIRYRRVKLLCGSVLMSEADNWYIPSRLTVEMNRLLETTDTPFGQVVQSLHFQRHTLSSKLLWQPLPQGWEMGAQPRFISGSALAIPAAVLQNRAVLSMPDGTPLSEVVETYMGGVLAFATSSP